MRNAKKVATVFTGAAACAAAFTPAAQAATTQTAHGQQTTAAPRTAHNCTIGPPTTSVVFTWPASRHHGPTCVNTLGPTALGAKFVNVCPGDYNISLLVSGTWIHVPHSQSFTANGPRTISWVDVLSRAGNFPPCRT